MVAAVLVKVPVLAGEGVEDLGREPNLGSLDTMVGMARGASRARVDIRPRPLHHGDTEEEELERKKTTETDEVCFLGYY